MLACLSSCLAIYLTSRQGQAKTGKLTSPRRREERAHSQRAWPGSTDHTHHMDIVSMPAGQPSKACPSRGWCVRYARLFCSFFFESHVRSQPWVLFFNFSFLVFPSPPPLLRGPLLPFALASIYSILCRMRCGYAYPTQRLI